MSLMNCRECGNIISDTTSVCLHCGCPVEKQITCSECGNEISETASECNHCGCPVEKVEVTKKKSKKTTIIIVIIVIIVAIIIGGKLIYDNYVEEKYIEAISYFEQENYEKALELFNHNNLQGYKLSNDYSNVIQMISLINEEKYDEALAYKYVSEEISIVPALKRYAQNGSDYKAQNYKAIWENNKYFPTFYNEKEKEMVYEGIYNYGISLYNEGYYGTTKELFTKIKDYKNSTEILNDKYFQLVGNYYGYGTTSGYTYASMSLGFSDYDDTLVYNAFVQSVFSTNLPSGNWYDYKIKNNKLIIGNNFVTYDIVSFDGNTLVIKDGRSKFTLKKS